MEKELDKSVKEEPTAEANETKNKIDNYVIGIYITLCILAVIEAFSASAREIAMAGSVYKPILCRDAADDLHCKKRIHLVCQIRLVYCRIYGGRSIGSNVFWRQHQRRVA